MCLGSIRQKLKLGFKSQIPCERATDLSEQAQVTVKWDGHESPATSKEKGAAHLRTCPGTAVHPESDQASDRFNYLLPRNRETS